MTTSLSKHKMISTKDFCDLLGVTSEFLRTSAINNPEFPKKHKFGKMVRYKLEEVLTFIEKSEVVSVKSDQPIPPKKSIKRQKSNENKIR